MCKEVAINFEHFRVIIFKGIKSSAIDRESHNIKQIYVNTFDQNSVMIKTNAYEVDHFTLIFI